MEENESLNVGKQMKALPPVRGSKPTTTDSTKSESINQNIFDISQGLMEIKSFELKCLDNFKSGLPVLKFQNFDKRVKLHLQHIESTLRKVKANELNQVQRSTMAGKSILLSNCTIKVSIFGNVMFSIGL